MTNELAKAYEPSEVQERCIQQWSDAGYCDANPDASKESHTIMIPLPNVTGALHMGHCLNGTVQDLLTRFRRMEGKVALWMPGTDHAGIATQAVVERRMLEEEGLTRHDIGRDALVDRIWKWKDQYEARILNQLKQIGASCDWRRVRFTLDDVCSQAVRRTFFKMFSDGLIFRGKRLVNWDTHLQTAVADDEVYTEDIDGQFWTFHYPVVDESGQPTGQKISFSTTRPETMLGDTAVCVHPSDERYTELVGKKVLIPVNGRLIPIIADALLADKEKGTGAVKVTPAHDPNDYACGLRNDLPMINIMNPDATINEEGGEFSGLDRFDARKAINAKMEELGHYEGVEDRQIPMKFSDRSKTPVEPYLSDQWFVKMDTLAQSAMDAVEDKRVRIFPQRYTKTYMDWLGEKRDWCISRQLWWGHRIPIWSRPATADEIASNKDGALFGLPEFGDQSQVAAVVADGVQPGDKIVLVCVSDGQEEIQQQLEAAGFEQDPDVLDTWFSSALWPHATLGWPNVDQNPPTTDSPEGSGETNEVLDFFYPGSVLVTSRDIITLWVARMVLTGLYNMGDVPFKHVYIHPKILDGFGQTMSKSKGNGVDPLELIEKYGTDAVRFTIASLCGETQDVRLPVGYECPHCQEIIPSKQLKVGNLTVVVPASLNGTFPVPQGGTKPTIKCAKCKEESQFSTPLYDVDEGVPVARIVSERFEYGRNFCNKLWNATRFAFMNLEGYQPTAINDDDLQMEDRWVLSRLATTAKNVNTMLNRYQFDQATRTVRDFTWNEFCDWYLEMVKPRLREEASRPVAQTVLTFVIDSLLKLLHPFAPFITEELWQKLNEVAPIRGLYTPTAAAESVMVAQWPYSETATETAEVADALIDTNLEQRFERLQETIVAVRNVRGLYKISPKQPLKLFMKCSEEVAIQMRDVTDQFANLSKTLLEAAGVDVERPGASATITLADANGFIPLEGLIDLDAEVVRLKKEEQETQKHLTNTEKKLSNEKFISNAPEKLVADVRETLERLTKQLESIQRSIQELS